jgi:hypothetical protein
MSLQHRRSPARNPSRPRYAGVSYKLFSKLFVPPGGWVQIHGIHVLFFGDLRRAAWTQVVLSPSSRLIRVVVSVIHMKILNSRFFD